MLILSHLCASVIPHVLVSSPTGHQSAYVTADELSFPACVDCDRMCSIAEVARPSVVHSECSRVPYGQAQDEKCIIRVLLYQKVPLTQTNSCGFIKGVILCNPHILGLVVDQSTE